jgi:hypothetical protein
MLTEKDILEMFSTSAGIHETTTKHLGDLINLHKSHSYIEGELFKFVKAQAEDIKTLTQALRQSLDITNVMAEAMDAHGIKIGVPAYLKKEK